MENGDAPLVRVFAQKETAKAAAFERSAVRDARGELDNGERAKRGYFFAWLTM
jgi:hypothetical protein